MPWIQTEPEMERRKFVQAALRREEPMKVLCRRFGISRKTGYKMLARHAKSGQPGLADISRAPKAHPNQTPPEKEAAIRKRPVDPSGQQRRRRHDRRHDEDDRRQVAWADRGPGEEWTRRARVRREPRARTGNDVLVAMPAS